MHTSLYNQSVQRAGAQSHPSRAVSWEQAALGGGLFVIGSLFVYLGNGFPPQAWGEFVQFVTGQRIGQPFVPVLLQSFLYLVGWLLLLLAALRTLRPAYLLPFHGDTSHKRPALTSTPARTIAGNVLSERSMSAKDGLVNRAPTDRVPADIQRKVRDNQESQYRQSGQDGDRASASPALLSQVIASSREYTASTSFSLRSEIAPPTSSDGATGALLSGALECRPARFADGKGVEDALMVASGLCRPLTYASSSDLAPFTLFVIASGRTDERLQQAASRICVQAISHALCGALTKNVSFSMAGIESLLGKSIQRTNAMLYQHNQKHASACEASVTAILIVGGIACIAHVGNHHAYLYRPNKGFKHLTHDRPAQPEEAERSCVDDCVLGKQALVRVQTHQTRLQVYDLLILCSHGFWRQMSQEAFLQFMQSGTEAKQQAASQVCHALLKTVPIGEDDVPVSALVTRVGLL